MQVIRSAAEAIWAHWGAWQEASGGWEDCGTPAPEPHPMAELWDTPCSPDSYAFRTPVTDLRAGDFSVALRTYDPCEVLVSRVSPTAHSQGRPLAESQASRLRLLPRDQPFWLATFCRAEPDSFAQRERVQQQIGAQWEEVLLHNLWGEDLGQERLAQLRQSEKALHDEAAYWQTRYQEQNSLKQQMAELATQIARLRRQANQESDPAKARTLRRDSRALVEQHNALRQQWEQGAGSQALTVCVGVGGLRQADRDAWNTYAQLELDPGETQSIRMRRSTVVRKSPWRRLFDAGWRLLWLPERPGRHERVIADIMAHFVIYLSQEETIERETVLPWLQDYIRSVCRANTQAEVDYVLEVVLKEFALPLHTNSLQAFIKAELQQQRRQGDTDSRLVRGREEVVNAQATYQDGRHTSRRRKTQPRTFLAVQDAATRLETSPHTVRRRIRQGKIEAMKKGKYWQLSPAALDPEERKRLRHKLKNELIRLRVRWRSGGRAALEAEGAVHRAWDAARKWIEDQRKKQKTPGDVLALISGAPAIRKLLQQEPDILKRAQELLVQCGPDVAWE